MKDQTIELPPLPEPDQYTWYSRNLVESIRKRAIEPYAKRIAELEAARIAYASEFAPDEDGEPDVGRIHENIRKLKADRQRRGEPVNEEELLAAREALIDMGYLWDGDQWVEVDPPSKTAEQDPEWPDFARMEASLQRLKERLVFENGRRKDLEQRLREKRNG